MIEPEALHQLEALREAEVSDQVGQPPETADPAMERPVRGAIGDPDVEHQRLVGAHPRPAERDPVHRAQMGVADGVGVDLLEVAGGAA